MLKRIPVQMPGNISAAPLITAAIGSAAAMQFELRYDYIDTGYEPWTELEYAGVWRRMIAEMRFVDVVGFRFMRDGCAYEVTDFAESYDWSEPSALNVGLAIILNSPLLPQTAGRISYRKGGGVGKELKHFSIGWNHYGTFDVFALGVEVRSRQTDAPLRPLPGYAPGRPSPWPSEGACAAVLQPTQPGPAPPDEENEGHYSVLPTPGRFGDPPDIKVIADLDTEVILQLTYGYTERGSNESHEQVDPDHAARYTAAKIVFGEVTEYRFAADTQRPERVGTTRAKGGMHAPVGLSRVLDSPLLVKLGESDCGLFAGTQHYCARWMGCGRFDVLARVVTVGDSES